MHDPFAGDWQFGAPLPFVRDLCAYWLEEFDWRALEARVNRLEQVNLQLDGLGLHSLVQRSPDAAAAPVLLLHGWPGSCLDFLELCGRLAHPPEGRPAFHAVAPSLPGYGFSTTRPGVGPQHIAGMLVRLMDGLGFGRFMVHGGNWGSVIGTEIARQFPERVIGLHLSSVSGGPPPAGEDCAVSEEERGWLVDPGSFPHFALLSRAPAAPAHALNDSPAGLAAWLAEKLHDWADNRFSAGSALSPEFMLRSIALYWLTGCIASSMRLYYEMVQSPPRERYVAAPTAVAVFPASVAKLPRAWTQRLYNLQQWTVYERGGHFPALELPAVLAEDLRRFAHALLSGR